MPNTHFAEFQGPAIEILQSPTLRCIGRCSGMTTYHAATHIHQCVEVIYVQRGEGSVTIAQQEFSIQPGMLAFYNANVPHSEQLSSLCEDIVFYHVKLEDFVLSRLPAGRIVSEGETPVIHCKKDGVAIQLIMELMYAEARNGDLGYQQALEELTATLFILILRELKRNHVSIPVSVYDSVVFRVQRYIMAHYQEQITVGMLADIFHINSCYLSHAFKNQLGHSPYQYLTELRINAATRLLKTNELSISGIAEAVGYSNTNTFESQFRKKRGISASAYRKQEQRIQQFADSP